MFELLFFYLLFGLPVLLLLKAFRLISVPYWAIVLPAVLPAAAVLNVAFVLLLLGLS